VLQSEEFLLGFAQEKGDNKVNNSSKLTKFVKAAG
jgi:hypothetical protein